jgi:hypothetical protein
LDGPFFVEITRHLSEAFFSSKTIMTTDESDEEDRAEELYPFYPFHLWLI